MANPFQEQVSGESVACEPALGRPANARAGGPMNARNKSQCEEESVRHNPVTVTWLLKRLMPPLLLLLHKVISSSSSSLSPSSRPEPRRLHHRWPGVYIARSLARFACFARFQRGIVHSQRTRRLSPNAERRLQVAS